MEEKIDEICIADIEGKQKVFGHLKKCNICDINFTAKQPCIVCDTILEKEKELGRALTKKEYDKLLEWLR